MMHIDAEKNLTSTTGACVEKKVLKKWVPRSENNKFFTTNALVIYDTNYSHAHEKFWHTSMNIMLKQDDHFNSLHLILLN